jgi:hypothetical protein
VRALHVSFRNNLSRRKSHAREKGIFFVTLSEIYPVWNANHKTSFLKITGSGLCPAQKSLKVEGAIRHAGIVAVCPEDVRPENAL